MSVEIQPFGVNSFALFVKSTSEIKFVLSGFPALLVLFAPFWLVTVPGLEFSEETVHSLREFLLQLSLVVANLIDEIESLLQEILSLLFHHFIVPRVLLSLTRFVELDFEHFVVVLEGHEDEGTLEEEIQVDFDRSN